MPEADSSVSTADPFERAFNIIAASTQSALGRMRDELATVRSELAQARSEQRSAPVVATQTPDTEAIATRAAALVPAPANGKDGRDGKDATIDVDSIIARVTDSVMLRVIEKIPPPIRGEKGERGEPGANGERGADGLSSPDEIRSFISEDRAMQWREFFMGVYRPDAEYRQGQAVTWNGSFWIATENTRSKPETDKTWLLAVKHGRDARK